MLKRYEKFLNDLDIKLTGYFESQKQHIKCKKGCCLCCEIGEYPFSRLEAEYLMQGYMNLSKDVKNIVRENIIQIKYDKLKFSGKRFLYQCPFLINNACSLYKYRGIVCRTYGLAYLDEKTNFIKLPECARKGLNYSDVFSIQKGTISLNNPIKEPLTINALLRSPSAQYYELECGEIRPLIEWFLQY